jgi:hypothetical protein
MGRKTAFFFSGHLNIYETKSALEHLGRHGTLKSRALWSVRDGKGLMQEFLERMGVSKTGTTTHHLQSNGVVECYVRTTKKHVRKVVSTYQSEWDEILPIFLLA